MEGSIVLALLEGMFLGVCVGEEESMKWLVLEIAVVVLIV